MAKKLYTLNEQGQALLKTLVDPYSSSSTSMRLWTWRRPLRMRICRTLRARYSVKATPVITPNQGAREEVSPDELPYLEELAAEVTQICLQSPQDARQRVLSEGLDDGQYRALWTYLDAPTRRKLKEAK
jgi:hypothetical protein